MGGHPCPLFVIKDRPAMAVRGVLLDMASYGRLPTMETFTSSIHLLSRMKLNQLHLYMRLSLKNDWQLPYSRNDLITLDRECHDRGISIIPCIDIIQPCNL